MAKMTKEQAIKWILDQFKCMGASEGELKAEKEKMEKDTGWIFSNLRLLG